MCRKLICLASFVLVLSLAGSAWSLEILIDDDFNGEGLDVGDAASVNGGFTLVTNALAAAESTAVETGSNAEVNTRGPWNSNAGIVSNASFNPLSEAALTEGLTVKWVVTSIGPAVHANGNTFVIATDSVFFNTLPHIGLNFSGAQAGTDQVAVRYRDPPPRYRKNDHFNPATIRAKFLARRLYRRIHYQPNRLVVQGHRVERPHRHTHRL